MKKHCIKAALLIVVFFLLSVAVNKVRLRYDWETAFWRTLMTPLTGTVWAKDFSEAGFAKVKYGMSKTEVVALVGEPLHKDCDQDGCGWSYSDQDTDTADSDRRWLAFDAKDTVIKIWHEFHID